ncbi:unnamed protein product, partial [Rangifer tarandus platyrhynchus]
MAGGGANSGLRDGPGTRYLRSGGSCCFREPPLPELQNGGAGDRSRELRAGQVTRVAGDEGGAMFRPRPWASRVLGLGGREGDATPTHCHPRLLVPFRSCFKTFPVWRWERSRGLVVDSKRQRSDWRLHKYCPPLQSRGTRRVHPEGWGHAHPQSRSAGGPAGGPAEGPRGSPACSRPTRPVPPATGTS